MRIYLFILLFAVASVVSGQSLSIKKYTTSDGLPQNSVYSIVQDDRGYLWMATEAGVTRFDGSSFKEYSTRDGLVFTSVRVVFQDSKGNMWFGTEKGISIFDGTGMTNFRKSDTFLDDYIQGIDEDSSGVVWIATRAGGIAKYVDSNVVTVNNELGLPEDALETQCLIDRNNDLWIGTIGHGLYKYSGDSLSRFTKADGLMSDSVTSVQQDAEGNIWIGSIYGASKYDGEKFTYIYLSESKKVVSKITFVSQDKEQNLWIGTDGKGLYYYDGETMNHYSDATGLPSNFINCYLEDRRGDLWFGARDGGAFRVPVEKFSIYHESTRDLQGLANKVVWSIYKDQQGKVWFGHFGSGISVFDEQNNSYEYLNTDNGLASNSVPAIIGDEKGNIWISTFGAGVMKYDGKRFKNYTADDGLFNNYVVSMLEDSEGNIWFGCEGGISMYDPKYDEIITDEGIGSITGDQFVFNIFEDYEGFLWFATATNGLLKFNKHKFIKAYTVQDGLPSDAIFYITQDKFGNFWIGTEGGGISRFDGENFMNFGKRDGLPSNVCYFLVEYSNYLYIGSTQGITRFEFMAYEEKGRDAFKTYTNKDGLAANEMNSGAVFKDRNYNLYFGTQEGVTKFNPKNKPREVATPVYIKNVRIIDEDSIRDSHPSATFDLDYTENNLSFEFIGVDFIAPEKVLYKYKLDGVDMNWTETNEHSITYRSLPANTYSFKVVCRNSDGFWSNEEATVPFIITPPFWETWWFYTISTIFALSLVYMFYTYKTRQVKRRNLELAQMVKRRTRELEEEKDKSDALLMNILPSSCVEELKEKGYVQPREFKNCSILFTDFKGFTYTASVLPADSLVTELNEIFKGFDEIVSKYGLEKMKTIGDSYMAAGGLPQENKDHALITVYAALEMQDFIKKRAETAPIKWEMRVGVHSGSVIAGVVGTKKFVYDIWGDTVNLASRMESSGEPGRVNVSAYTYMLIREHFGCEYRGKLDAKGKGKVDMYFVSGLKGKEEKISAGTLIG